MQVDLLPAYGLRSWNQVHLIASRKFFSTGEEVVVIGQSVSLSGSIHDPQSCGTENKVKQEELRASTAEFT